MDRCPHIKRRVWPEGLELDYCELTERPSGRIKPCLLMSGDTCPEWEQIKKEWAIEEREHGFDSLTK